MAPDLLRKIVKDDHQFLFQNYGDRLPVCFVSGEGAYLHDQNKRRYIDFFSGIAVSLLGHHHTGLSKRLHSQVDRILHSSNWFFNREQIEAAKGISRLTYPGKTLFVNSGTEANEAAIKLARKYGLSRSPEKYQIISFQGSFHGRTFGGMSATAQEKIRKGFGPMVPGFIHLPFNNPEALKKEMSSNPNICAVITELIQGEGGIIPADRVFVREVAALAKQHNALFVIDEIQTGMGRTGKAFAFQHYGIKPDMITLAKGLGGGLPIGALHARDGLSEYLEKGSHGTTFGGNHLACAAAAYVLAELGKPAFLKKVRTTADYITGRLLNLKKQTSLIRDIRGLGLLVGIELGIPGMDLVKKALSGGLVINCTSEKVIRIAPPLNIPMKVVREGMSLLEKIILSEEPVN